MGLYHHHYSLCPQSLECNRLTPRCQLSIPPTPTPAQLTSNWLAFNCSIFSPMPRCSLPRSASLHGKQATGL